MKTGNSDAFSGEKYLIKNVYESGKKPPGSFVAFSSIRGLVFVNLQFEKF